MNSNLNKFEFDFGIGSNNRSSKPLNEQKNKSTSNSNSYSSSTTPFSTARSTPAWQPGKPSWTHQPAPSQPGLTRTEFGGGASMVGDIKGKSWNSAAPSATPVASSIGIANKNPNLFGDLVSSAIGQNKSSSNAPLKSSAPSKSSFSMGSVANSLPKTSGASGYGNVGSSTTKNVGNASGYGNVNVSSNSGINGGNASWGFNQSSVSGTSGNASVNKGTGFGGGVGVGMNSNKDPFGSLNFSSKPMRSSVGGGGGGSSGIGSVGKSTAMPTQDFDFGDFEIASSKPNPSVFSSGSDNPLGSNAGGQEASGGNDWEFDSGFGGHGDESTTELDGLPPPPAGVSASAAKSKGLDNYKQGQYADAIKWLSWADVLLEKAGDGAGTMEVLSCRASCYKEVGEYKKAVADCTKTLLQFSSGCCRGIDCIAAAGRDTSTRGARRKPSGVVGQGHQHPCGVEEPTRVWDKDRTAQAKLTGGSLGTWPEGGKSTELGESEESWRHHWKMKGLSVSEFLRGQAWSALCRTEEAGHFGLWSVDQRASSMLGVKPLRGDIQGNFTCGGTAFHHSLEEVIRDGGVEPLFDNESCFSAPVVMAEEERGKKERRAEVLVQDGKNVAVLVQRALLYESMEKYRLGADDLRTVMKLDPGNRVARSTIHRLNKMAEC
ncbi:hypothetical protein KSS87_011534 [Heliosperma pusillum]|nr:hypothetical protein KSS87_011534 [Heliosperma pusillum]